jgi:energy-coupling factor transport system ATP-binding protein
MITIENLSYAYLRRELDNEPAWVLRDLNLQINPGEVLSIMGAPGAGKTTLCLALSGIVPQATGGVIRGDVQVNGMNTKRTPIHELTQIVGQVFQNPETQLFNMSVEAEVAFGLESMGIAPERIRERVDHALEKLELDPLRHRSPFKLSGGEMQRVAIASVLAMDPEVLVLDEPSSHLDMRGKEEVYDTLSSLRKDRSRTIIVVENQVDYVAAFSDKVIVMREGTIAYEGTPGKLFASTSDLEKLAIHPPQVHEVGRCLAPNLGGDPNFLTVEQAFVRFKDKAGA